MPATPDEYRRWFEYETDSHRKVLASLNGVPEPLRSSTTFHKAVDLMAHLIAARLLWLYRFGVGDLAHLLAEMESTWSVYFARLDATEIARVFDYRSLEGQRFRNTIGDILTQLFGHSWGEPVPEPSA